MMTRIPGNSGYLTPRPGGFDHKLSGPVPSWKMVPGYALVNSFGEIAPQCIRRSIVLPRSTLTSMYSVCTVQFFMYVVVHVLFLVEE